jgi:uncharacterized protein YcbK (DUF882 family)
MQGSSAVSRRARAGLFARVSAGAAVLACAITAGAQPPSHTHRGTTASLGPASSPSPAAQRAAAAAYMDGNQPLVGLHAPSTKAIENDASGRPMLALTTVNHREALSLPATTDAGGFSAVDLDRVAHLLRAASGDEHPVDPRTLGLVYRIQLHFEAPEIRVVSGYRVPKPGSHSNHAKGRAMDIIVPGVPDEEVARFARELGFVGVGVYPTSQFVHVDIRPRSYF